MGMTLADVDVRPPLSHSVAIPYRFSTVFRSLLTIITIVYSCSTL
jgi:hypothetical protein